MRPHGEAAAVRANTIPRCGAGDEPMYSRNIPASFSVLSCPSDREELSFSNRWAQPSLSLLSAYVHKVITYIEYRAVSGVF